jgi:phage-related holin
MRIKADKKLTNFFTILIAHAIDLAVNAAMLAQAIRVLRSGRMRLRIRAAP